VATWWWLLSTGGRQVSPTAINWLLLGGAVYAAFDEVSQAIVDRAPSMNDFIADVIGMAVALGILQIRQRKRRGSEKT